MVYAAKVKVIIIFIPKNHRFLLLCIALVWIVQLLRYFLIRAEIDLHSGMFY